MILNSMKTLKIFFACVGLTLTTFTFNSCMNDDNSYSLGDMWMSIATARPLSDNTFYITLDDSTTLWPAAPLYIYYQPDKPQRVQINYTVLGDNYQGYDHVIKLNRIDTILTKSIAENMGEDNDSAYGNDPVEISGIWIGDGFLNILFKAYFSGNVKHSVNLIQTGTVDAPYEVEFRHNACRDHSSYLRYGIVAFDLSQIDTKGKNVTLTIKVNTFNGVKEIEKKYNSGENTEVQPELNWDKISLKDME
ncbi:MAG: NigD-like protein [Tannerellaceae bacterium]|nr:NigD-like protein [Tannerellaceae bacterium]